MCSIYAIIKILPPVSPVSMNITRLGERDLRKVLTVEIDLLSTTSPDDFKLRLRSRIPHIIQQLRRTANDHGNRAALLLRGSANNGPHVRPRQKPLGLKKASSSSRVQIPSAFVTFSNVIPAEMDQLSDHSSTVRDASFRTTRAALDIVMDEST